MNQRTSSRVGRGKTSLETTLDYGKGANGYDTITVTSVKKPDSVGTKVDSSAERKRRGKRPYGHTLHN